MAKTIDEAEREFAGWLYENASSTAEDDPAIVRKASEIFAPIACGFDREKFRDILSTFSERQANLILEAAESCLTPEPAATGFEQLAQWRNNLAGLLGCDLSMTAIETAIGALRGPAAKVIVGDGKTTIPAGWYWRDDTTQPIIKTDHDATLQGYRYQRIPEPVWPPKAVTPSSPVPRVLVVEKDGRQANAVQWGVGTIEIECMGTYTRASMEASGWKEVTQ